MYLNSNYLFHNNYILILFTTVLHNHLSVILKLTSLDVTNTSQLY